MLASCHAGQQDQQEKAESVLTDTLMKAARDSDAIKVYRQNLQQELSYYLDRHDADDEGFDMVERFSRKRDSVLAAYMPQQPLRLFSIGHWRSIPREGTVLTRDAVGRLIIGNAADDTLTSGVRFDSGGLYAGRLTRNGEASGHGAYRSLSGVYYEGQWSCDARHGFGFCVSDSFLHAGHWRRGRFLGERMHYTPSRIYGIDISRYQHDRGKKRYAIDWNRLRIVGLGHRISEHRVAGAVDYPVSFVYIKSTEGISIKNKYFPADYVAARQHGVPVGAYHFFSTKQSASAQAHFFLQSSRFRRGDLPPMLDVEPTDAMVEKMGGAERMFHEIRVWLRMVEASIGVRPILYVNQRFVRTHMKHAPDLKRDYLVWIARYGEYKPDVHLVLWQLSADGRVRGIVPECDINVFNGYQSQWEEFLREETIQ